MKHNVARFNQTQDPQAKARWKSPIISEMLPGFLEYLKVELGRSPATAAPCSHFRVQRGLRWQPRQQEPPMAAPALS
jgi:hypothetical protein